MSCQALNCQAFIDLLIDYVEGDLDAEAHQLCHGHLDLCRACADYLESYRVTTELGRRVYRLDDTNGQVDLPEELVQEILQRAGLRS